MTSGVLHQLINAQVMHSMDVREVLQQAEITSTQSNLPDLEPLNLSTSNTEELRLELNFQRVTGSGQLFGYFQSIMLMEDGQHLVKSIWLNPEEMTVMDKLEALTLSEPLFILVQTGNMMPMKKLQNNINILNPSVTISMFMVLNGMLMVSSQPLMAKKF